MKTLTQEQLFGIIRHTLTFVGGVLIMKGLASELLVNELIGAAMTITGGIWSIIKNK